MAKVAYDIVVGLAPEDYECRGAPAAVLENYSALRVAARRPAGLLLYCAGT